MAEVAEFMSESSGEDSDPLPSTSLVSSLTTMANFQIPPPDILELNDGSTASNWRTWVSAWNNYRLATKLDKEEEARQQTSQVSRFRRETHDFQFNLTVSRRDKQISR